MEIFSYDQYKNYIIDRLKIYGDKRGEFKTLADETGIHLSQVSQILRGKAHLTFDQAYEVAEYFSLNEIETEYFINLVLKSRARKRGLKELISTRIEQIKNNQAPSNQKKHEDKITDAELEIFFSSWHYSATFLIASIGSINSVEALAEKLALPRQTVQNILGFLVRNSMLSFDGKRYRVTQRMVVDVPDHLKTRNRLNWRQRGMDRLTMPKENDLFMTYTMALSHADIKKLDSLIQAFISTADNKLAVTKPEESVCLNIDWFII